MRVCYVWISFGNSSHANPQLSIHKSVTSNYARTQIWKKSELKTAELKPNRTLEFLLKIWIRSIGIEASLRNKNLVWFSIFFLSFNKVKTENSRLRNFTQSEFSKFMKTELRVNWATFGIAYSIGIEKLCGINRNWNSLKRKRIAEKSRNWKSITRGNTVYN